jgi:hypothetical protein
MALGAMLIKVLRRSSYGELFGHNINMEKDSEMQK